MGVATGVQSLMGKLMSTCGSRTLPSLSRAWQTIIHLRQIAATSQGRATCHCSTGEPSAKPLSRWPMRSLAARTPKFTHGMRHAHLLDVQHRFAFPGPAAQHTHRRARLGRRGILCPRSRHNARERVCREAVRRTPPLGFEHVCRMPVTCGQRGLPDGWGLTRLLSPDLGLLDSSLGHTPPVSGTLRDARLRGAARRLWLHPRLCLLTRPGGEEGGREPGAACARDASERRFRLHGLERQRISSARQAQARAVRQMNCHKSATDY
jgi:hypothetical protein